MRLPRSRKGKTAIDVTPTLQNGLKRARITIGDTDSANKRNSDMDEKEVADLITILEFTLAKLKGEVPWDA